MAHRWRGGRLCLACLDYDSYRLTEAWMLVLARNFK